MELSGLQLFVPVAVSALVTLVRQFSAGLDGNRAYWFSIAVNVVGQTAAQLMTDGDPMAGAALGLGTGAVVGPGLATTVKRLGLGKLVKPRKED